MKAPLSNTKGKPHELDLCSSVRIRTAGCWLLQNLTGVFAITLKLYPCWVPMDEVRCEGWHVPLIDRSVICPEIDSHGHGYPCRHQRPRYNLNHDGKCWWTKLKNRRIKTKKQSITSHARSTWLTVPLQLTTSLSLHSLFHSYGDPTESHK
jgi:hypothetical protein